MSGEKPEEALVREAMEETGRRPTNLIRVDKGLNSYNKYRYLFTGETEDRLGEGDPSEVEWVRFISLEELHEKQKSGELTFVDEFFEDTQLAMSQRRYFGER